MIKVMSWWDLEWGVEVESRIWSLSNGIPDKLKWRVSGKVGCLVPLWKDVNEFKEKIIDEEEFVNRYRELIRRRWKDVKRWLDSLGDEDLILCCWEKKGFCHRYLVVKLIEKFRSDLKLEVS